MGSGRVEAEAGGGVNVPSNFTQFLDIIQMTPHKWRKLDDTYKRVLTSAAKRWHKRLGELVNFMERNPPKPQRSAFPLKQE